MFRGLRNSFCCPLVFPEKDCFQQCTAIRLLICSGMVLWENVKRKNDDKKGKSRLDFGFWLNIYLFSVVYV